MSHIFEDIFLGLLSSNIVEHGMDMIIELAPMFTKWHILNDENSFNDDDDELIESKKGIIDIGGITITNDSEILTDDVEGSNETPSLNVERALVHLCFLMQNVINECKQEGVALCDHAISYLWVLESDI